MNTKFAVLASAFLLTTGCGSMNGPTNPPASSEDGSAVSSDASVGSSSGGTQKSSSQARTREEVRAEAIEAMKNYKPTVEQERDWFNPYAR